MNNIENWPIPLAIPQKPSYTPSLNERYGLVGHAYPLKEASQRKLA